MGNTLFKEVVRLTGLPEETIFDELSEIVEQIGANPNELTLDQLRQAMLYYLEDLVAKTEIAIDEQGEDLVKIIDKE